MIITLAALFVLNIALLAICDVLAFLQHLPDPGCQRCTHGRCDPLPGQATILTSTIILPT